MVDIRKNINLFRLVNKAKAKDINIISIFSKLMIGLVNIKTNPFVTLRLSRASIIHVINIDTTIIDNI